MSMLEITTKMENVINEKAELNEKLTSLCNKLVEVEIKEATERTSLMNELQDSGVKMTEKSKVAKCDKELHKEIVEIKHLKNDIATIKREIDLCNDKLSLFRNVIREMQLISQ